MKKIVAAVAILLICIAGIYCFIPNVITAKGGIYIVQNRGAVMRSLGDTANWKQWWPSKTLTYKIDNISFSQINLQLKKNNNTGYASLNILPGNNDSLQLIWNFTTPTSYNPVQRLLKWATARSMQNDLPIIAGALKKYHENVKSLYKVDIRFDTVPNTTFISTFINTSYKPSTKDIYTMIEQLQAYTKQYNTRETNAPMLNISKTANNNFITRVAIPIEKAVPASKNVTLKWMPGGGRMLTTEVIGGEAVVDKALKSMELFISDHGLQPPAIPFQSLITDRSITSDSTKWMTKIYYPIM